MNDNVIEPGDLVAISTAPTETNLERTAIGIVCSIFTAPEGGRAYRTILIRSFGTDTKLEGEPRLGSRNMKLFGYYESRRTIQLLEKGVGHTVLTDYDYEHYIGSKFVHLSNRQERIFSDLSIELCQKYRGYTLTPRVRQVELM